MELPNRITQLQTKLRESNPGPHAQQLLTNQRGIQTGLDQGSPSHILSVFFIENCHLGH